MESIGWMLRLAFVALVSTAFCVEAEELSGGATSVPTPVAKERFHVFDATLYASKPDLSAYGIDPLPVVYQTQLWPESEALDRVPTSKMLKTILSKLGSVSLVCFDVEHWKLLAGEGSFEQNMEKFGELTRRVHELAPGVSVGYYGVAPVRDYWRAISAPDGHKHAQWQAENQSLEPLVKSVDVVFPSAYTFYRDQAGWKRMAVAQIMAARSYEKPVYVFLWPHYHDSNKFLSGYYIGDEYWRMELETVRQYADGVVIWGGWGNGKPQIWDDHAAWWEVTKKFLRDLGH